MNRLLASAAVALVLTGSAQAASFVPTTTTPLPLPAQSAQPVLPSASAPNAAGSLILPDGWMEHAHAPQQVSYDQLLGLWQGAGAAYGIPWQVLAAINKVESNFGRNMGPSSAGAIGWMQFMPSTWLRWGWDYDGDGYADPWAARDAIYSAARYLAAAGGAADIAHAVYSYNHAQWYVNEVLSLAQVFGSDASLTFELDGLQVSLEHAQQRLARANVKLQQTESAARSLRAVETTLMARAARVQLISERGPLRLQALRAGSQAALVESRLPSLQEAVKQAQAKLKAARAQAQSASFNPVTAPLFASPSYGSDGYVFPVGGGAGSVAVSHSHHDYPAADIAAPTGSPVYALTDGVVVNAWDGIDPSCGIGLTMRADDGQVWTYCHLSYREASVRDGTRLPAGVEIGLVGATGDATGPHLHLQLQPPTSYPQDEPWFQSFAGIAYRWDDSSPLTLPDGGASGPVFAMVSGDSERAQAVPALFEIARPESSAAKQTVLPRVAPAHGRSQLSAGGPRAVFAAPAGTTAGSAAQGGKDGHVIEFTR
jgi:murein DD-endopeptidase MepM/ murein hydrolase activator NlpD